MRGTFEHARRRLKSAEYSQSDEKFYFKFIKTVWTRLEENAAMKRTLVTNGCKKIKTVWKGTNY